MGRIVIPRVRQEARQQLQRKRRTGYFANGFGPQEMQLVSKLADLAVAGGGQIARAVQIEEQEKEQAEAQAEYDQRLQSEIESRQRAAQAEIDDASVSGQVEAFFAQQEPPSVRERLPSLSSMSLQSDLVQPRPMQRGGVSPGVLARPGVLAPEDLSMARAQMAARLQPDTMVSAMQRPDVAAVFDLGDAAGLEAVEDAMRRGVIDPAGMPRTSVDEAEGIMNAASMRAYSDALQRLEQLDRQGVQESVRRLSSPLVPQEQMLDLASKYDFSPDALERMAQRSADYSSYTPEQMVAAGVSLPAAPTRQSVQLGRPSAFRGATDPAIAERLRQEMQGRDFRQEAMEAVGPAPERKLFRIADILAAAPSARTAEQRAMLLQAASDSPDIQATSLSDLAKGAYRDRAMQAVMKLFPEEEEPMSELDKLRIESMRERMETENLRQQKLQAELDKDAAAAERRANAATRTNPGRAKKEALYAFYTKNWPRREAMGDEAWSSGAGELADMTPSGLPAWVRNNKLSRGTRRSVNTTVGRLLQMRPKPDPRPPRTTLTPSEEIRLESTITRLETQEADAMSKVRAFEATLSDTKTLKLAEKRGISKAQIDAAIAGEKEKARIAREGIKASKARLETKPEATPAPSGAVYNAATGQYE